VPSISIVSIVIAAVCAGAIAWTLLWPSLHLASLFRFKGVFPELVQNAAGAHARRDLRLLERELMILAAAALAALGAAVTSLLFAAPRLGGVWLWALFGLSCALAVVWAVFLVRHLRRWRDLRFAARAQAAFAASLARLNLQGMRVFHDVVLDGVSIDHVVLGTRGLFAVRLVARRPQGDSETVVRINGRSIEFQDGTALLDTLSLTERAARALADM
jgi:hypothetical protein